MPDTSTNVTSIYRDGKDFFFFLLINNQILTFKNGFATKAKTIEAMKK